MRKVLAFTMTLMLALTFALGFGTVALAQADLQNGSFEQVGDDGLPVSWTTYDWNQRNPADGKPATFTVVTDSSAKDGKNYMKIVAPDANDARLRGAMTLDENTKYKISAWAKAVGVPADAKCGANISLDGSTVTSIDLKGTSTDWQQLVYYIDSADHTNLTVTVGIGTYAKASKGTVLFDAVTLEKVTEVPAGAAFFRAGSNNEPANPTSNDTPGGISPVLITIIIIAALLVVVAIVYIFYKRFKSEVLNADSNEESFEEEVKDGTALSGGSEVKSEDEISGGDAEKEEKVDEEKVDKEDNDDDDDEDSML